MTPALIALLAWLIGVPILAVAAGFCVTHLRERRVGRWIFVSTRAAMACTPTVRAHSASGRLARGESRARHRGPLHTGNRI